MNDQKNLNQPVTLGEMSRVMSKLMLENNVILVNMMDEKIAKNNDVLIPLIDKKIKNNNVVLVKMMDEKIKDNNVVLVKMMDEKIKDNNEYIFDNFNDQTDRILSLFKGVLRVRKDGTVAMSV